MVGVEHVVVARPAVVERGRVTVEEGVLDREMGVGVEAYERVYVDGEWGLIVAEQLDDRDHVLMDVGPEIASRWEAAGARVDIGVEGDGDLHLVAMAGLR